MKEAGDDAGDPGLRTLEMLTVKTLQEGWEGRVTAQHARAMALYPEPYYRKIEALLKKARIGIVSDPHTGPLYARVCDLFALNNMECVINGLSFYDESLLDIEEE